MFEQYLMFIYYAYQASSTGCYGDIYAKSNKEILFQTIFMVFAKFLYSFITAEITNYISELFAPQEDAVKVVPKLFEIIHTL